MGLPGGEHDQHLDDREAQTKKKPGGGLQDAALYQGRLRPVGCVHFTRAIGGGLRFREGGIRQPKPAVDVEHARACDHRGGHVAWGVGTGGIGGFAWIRAWRKGTSKRQPRNRGRTPEPGPEGEGERFRTAREHGTAESHRGLARGRGGSGVVGLALWLVCGRGLARRGYGEGVPEVWLVVAGEGVVLSCDVGLCLLRGEGDSDHKEEKDFFQKGRRDRRL